VPPIAFDVSAQEAHPSGEHSAIWCVDSLSHFNYLRRSTPLHSLAVISVR